jgi:hypothetical protein
MTAAAVSLERRPGRIGVIVGLVTFVFFATVINLQTHGWVAWYHLTVDGQRAVGVVTGNDPADHNTCRFSYAVQGETYSSADQGCAAATGQSVNITYDPGDPGFATTASPAGQLGILVGGPAGLAILGGLLASLSAARRNRRR